MINNIIPHKWKTSNVCIIYVDNMLLTNRYEIAIGFDTSTENPLLHDIAFEKVQMLFEVIMNNSIIMSKVDFENMSHQHENNYIKLFDILNDQALGSVLFLKLMSLVGNDMLISYLQISSELGKYIKYTINSDSPELLCLIPKKEEWWDSNEIKFDPWWNRNDTATYDKILKENEIYQGEFKWEEQFEEDIEKAKSLDIKSGFQIINGGKK